jgi:hypothetical protein
MKVPTREHPNLIFRGSLIRLVAKIMIYGMLSLPQAAETTFHLYNEFCNKSNK